MEELKYLDKFYDKLKGAFIIEYGKLKNPSLLITFFLVKKNTRYEMLRKGAIISHKIPTSKLNILVKENYIRETDNPKKYALTAKGIWSVEKKKQMITVNELLDFMDKKYFQVFEDVNKSLNEKDKLILFSLLSARAYSEDSSADLKKGKRTKDAWKKIVQECYDFLKKQGEIKSLKGDKIFGSTKIEHPVSNIFRHTDKLPRLTRNVWTASGNQRYYLDLANDEKLKEDYLKFLINKIFTNSRLDSSMVEKIERFMRKLAHQNDIYLFDLECHKFSTAEYDEKIRNILMCL